MNRRDFFTRLTTGFVGTCVATTLPLKWLPSQARVEGLQMVMSKTFNEFVKGSGSRDMGNIKIFASHSVFTQFSHEMTVFQRFVPSDEVVSKFPALMFKSVTMYNTGDMDGQWFTITNGTRSVKRYV